MTLTSPPTMSQSSASYLTLLNRRASNLKMTAMQAMVKQTAFVAMILGTRLSEMCLSWSMTSAGVGMEAIMYGDFAVVLCSIAGDGAWGSLFEKKSSGTRCVSTLREFSQSCAHGDCQPPRHVPLFSKFHRLHQRV